MEGTYTNIKEWAQDSADLLLALSHCFFVVVVVVVVVTVMKAEGQSQ